MKSFKSVLFAGLFALLIPAGATANPSNNVSNDAPIVISHPGDRGHAKDHRAKIHKKHKKNAPSLDRRDRKHPAPPPGMKSKDPRKKPPRIDRKDVRPLPPDLRRDSRPIRPADGPLFNDKPSFVVVF